MAWRTARVLLLFTVGLPIYLLYLVLRLAKRVGRADPYRWSKK